MTPESKEGPLMPTFAATIWVGLRVRATGQMVPMDIPRTVIQEYCDANGFCVSVSPTEFIYTNGGEPGFSVGIINYPRFPSEPVVLRERAIILAMSLRVACKQLKVCVVMQDETVMIGDPESATA